VLGVIDRLDRRPPGCRLVDGDQLVLLGPRSTGLAGSRWAAAQGKRFGTLPALDLALHRRLLGLVRDLVTADRLSGVHDVADGGLALCLAEMALASGVGFEVSGIDGHAELFSEAPSRVVLCVAPEQVDGVRTAAAAAGIPIASLGRAGGDRLVVDGLVDMALVEATSQWRQALPDALHPETSA
jgi:phosphoribosylformylglycinamidine synthase